LSPSPTRCLDPATTLPFRWQGRLYSVRLPPAERVAFDNLLSLILDSLCPNRRRLFLGDAPLIYFYGCALNCSAGSQRIQRLNESQEPRSWEELAKLKHQGGYIEIQTRCRGGGDTGQTDSAAYVPPAFQENLDWDAINTALSSLAGASPAPSSTALPDVSTLALYLHRHFHAGAFAELSDWPPGYNGLTPARLSALYELLERDIRPGAMLPDWYSPSSWVDIRINSLPKEA